MDIKQYTMDIAEFHYEHERLSEEIIDSFTVDQAAHVLDCYRINKSFPIPEEVTAEGFCAALNAINEQYK